MSDEPERCVGVDILQILLSISMIAVNAWEKNLHAVLPWVVILIMEITQMARKGGA